ncbi:MAG: nodulation protein [Frankiales bacterium]|nr:nodulation protein [Frankiales bacterium]
MTTNGEKAFAAYSKYLGTTMGTGDWFTVDQERINAFGEITEDRQYIHVDPERAAKESPYKVTIAHGFLTLSLFPALMESLPDQEELAAGVVAGLNYGFDKLRFLSPVKVDSRIRAVVDLKNVELRDPNTIQITRTVTVEIEGETKPALVAEWLSRRIYS